MTVLGARIFSVILLATCVAAADDAEFAFNLLSDIAPILALFGDQFARQFTSESLTWIDHVIFAMVPLGIVTAITSAIRVQGMQVAKAFIGRARENRALAEIELMSSTSGEVCELFNGSSIVRAMGKPKIAQIIIFPREYEKLEAGHESLHPPSVAEPETGSGAESDPKAKDKDKSCGIHSLRSATLNADEKFNIMKHEVYHSESYIYLHRTWKYLEEWMSYCYAASNRYLRTKTVSRVSTRKRPDVEALMSIIPPTGSSPENEITLGSTGPSANMNVPTKTDVARLPSCGESAFDGPKRALDCPPNLQLNLSSDHFDQNKLKKRHEIMIAAIIAVLLQTGLIAIAAVTAFLVSPDSSLLESRAYGFPCYAAGSVLLSFGTGLCSLIVEKSTIEYSWRPAKKDPVGEGDAPRVVWLQQKQTVNDQAFDGYVISGGPKRRIITSSRDDDVKGRILNVNKDGCKDPGPDNKIASNATKTETTKMYVTKTQTFWEWLTVCAALTAAVGFTAQFMGLRGLAFPCSIAHLGAIFIMALIRAGVRRRLGRIPDFHLAVSGYELDFLATQIAFYPNFRDFSKPSKRDKMGSEGRQPSDFFQWTVRMPSRQNPHTPFFVPIADRPTCTPKLKYIGEDESKPIMSKQVLRVRERLGDLTAWTSSSSSAALSLAQSIECVLDKFFPPQSPPPIKPLKWFVEASMVTSSEVSTQDIFHVRLWREAKKWRVDLGRIDAALSLWMAQIGARNANTPSDTGGRRWQKGASRKPKSTTHSTGLSNQTASDWRRAKAGDSLTYSFYRIVGNDLGDGVLKRDISWWIDSLVAEQSVGGRKRDDADLVIGFNGARCPPPEHTIERQSTTPGTHSELGLISNGPLPTILAQHLFTSFMWTLVQCLPDDCLDLRSDEMHEEVEIDPPSVFSSYDLDQNWLRLRFHHRKLTKLVRDIESYGLGRTNDILLCMIPALSSRKLLPNQAIQALIPRVGSSHGWTETAACCHKLLEKVESCPTDDEDSRDDHAGQATSTKDDKLKIAIVIATMDFLSLAYEPYSGQQSNPQLDLDSELEAIVGKLASTKFATILKKLAPFYGIQHRHAIFKNIFEHFGRSEHISQFIGSFQNSFDENFAKRSLGFTPYHLLVVPEIQGFNQFGVRRLKFSKDDSNEYRLVAQDKVSLKPDLFGWTPWHYVSLLESPGSRALLRSVEKTDNQLPLLLDNLRRSPIHIAASEAMDTNLEIMMDSLSDDSQKSILQAGGLDGMTPIHLNSKSGSLEFLDSIPGRFKTREVLEMKDLWGRQALHIATRSGHDHVAVKLIRLGARPDQLDDMGKSSIDYFSELWLWRQSQQAPLQAKAEDSNVDAADSNENVRNIHYMDKKDSEMFLKFAMKSPGHLYGHGRTFLHIAITIVETESVYALLGMRFDIEAQDDDGRTPLHYAILTGRESLVEDLIKGISTDGKWFQASPSAKDSRNTTPLMFAAEKNLLVVAGALLDRTGPEAIGQTNNDGKTALHYARNLGMVQLLVGKGSDFLRADSDGMTALHTAIDNKEELVALFLLDLEDHQQRYEKPFNRENESLLVTACKRGLAKVVPRIMERWPTIINTEDQRYGQTPLSWACENGFAKIVEQLLSHEAIKVNQPAPKYVQYTPLHLAVRSKSLEVVDLLLKTSSITLDPPNVFDQTPLQIAVEDDCPDIVRKLILADRMPAEQRIRNVKEFVFGASEGLRQLTSDVLKTIHEQPLICNFLVWLVCDGKPMGGSRQDVINTDISALVAPIAEKLASKAWNQLRRPYDLINLLSEARFRDALLGQHVDKDGFDQDKWSYRDYITRFERGDSLKEAFGVSKNPTANQENTYGVPTRLNVTHDLDSIRVTACKQNHDSNGCSGIQDIHVVEQSRDNSILCIRSDHSIPPNRKFFYFEITVLRDSWSKIIGIGFCGLGDTTRKMPGWFPGSWGYHGDDGALFVESEYGHVPTLDFGNAGTFRRGDTVGAYLNMRTGDVFCTLNGTRLDMGYGLNNPGGRFRYGKLYPCIGFDVEHDGVGMGCRVNLHGSASHPFMCEIQKVFQDQEGKTS